MGLSCLIHAQEQQGTFTIEPETFGPETEITVTVSGIDPSIWGVTDMYFWTWYVNGAGQQTDSPTNGVWEDSNENQKFADNGDGTFSFSYIPSALYGTADIVQIGMLAKAKNGTGDKKTQDVLFDVQSLELNRTSPAINLTTLTPGSDFTIEASTNMDATFTLFRGETVLDQSANPEQVYSFTLNDITETQSLTLQAQSGSVVRSSSFTLYVPGALRDGINLDADDPTRATLVFYAPGKNSVHVIGDFNNWQQDEAYRMNSDGNGRFVLELTGLTPGANHLYQYLVDETLNVADPYSTLILDGFDNDSFIPSEVYPNIPDYPVGQTKAITVLNTQETPYEWQITDFEKPRKEDLVIYELLIRDFDQRHSFDAVVDRLDYLEELGVNAIEFMPVNEFDGNISWGYNPSFHMALDKYYGTKNAFKALIDECHRRGMAVFLDVVYNHGTGQHPYYQMWNTDNGGTGGQARADNPFFNQSPRHAYNVFNDFDHSSQATREYVIQTAQYWIEEFHIDGMRWDLTKGFTQNCTSNDEGCTNSTQPDRIEVLKLYADAQWAVDPDFIIMFEHLGGIQEEEQWANYRVEEGKGILFWNKLTEPYNEATMGYHADNKSDFGNAYWENKGFQQPSAISYMESHDEERLMFKNLEFGNSDNPEHDVKDESTALSRMQTAGAFFYTIPGPKMLWQFGELGYDISIDQNGRTGEKPILWEYADEPDRIAIYNLWKELIRLKIEEPIFETDQVSLILDNPNGLKYVALEDPDAGEGEISVLAVLGNFGVTEQAVDPDWVEPGTWYELLNNNRVLNINQASGPISLQPGEFLLVADAPSQVLLDPNDLDGDGVPNANDLCPDTEIAATVDVDGCAVFTLPASNFQVQSQGSSCPGEDNGSISLTAGESLDYTVSLSLDGTEILSEGFTGSSWSTDSLAPGTYEVCFGVVGQADYQACFDLELTEPEGIAVSSKLNSAERSVRLELSGAKTYTVIHNDLTYRTSAEAFELNLSGGSNRISVRGDLDCQGVYEVSYYIVESLRAYPNPAAERLTLKSARTEGTVQVRGYDLSGRQVLSRQIRLRKQQEFELDISALRNGLYILEVGQERVRVLKQ